MSGPGLCAALALSLAAAPSGDLIQPQRGTSPALVLAPRDSRVGVLSITFRSGIYDDAEKPGLTRLAQHAIIGANTKVPFHALMAELYEADATLDIETGVRESTIRLVAPKQSFEALARKVTEMTLRPRLSQDEMPRAVRRLLVEELSPGHSVTISALLARCVFQDDYRFQNELLVDRDLVSGISFEDLQQHLQQRLCPANAQVVMVGPFDRARFAKHLAGFKGGRPAPPLKPSLTLPLAVHLRSRSRIQIVAFPLELRSSSEVAHARLLAALVEDRLYRKLRRGGQAYALEVLVQHTEWLDFLMAILPTGDQKRGAAEAMREEFDAVVAGKFTDDELATNRGHVAQALASGPREPVRLGRELAMAGPGVPWASEETAAALQAVTRESLKAYATRTVGVDRTIQISYGPERRGQ